MVKGKGRIRTQISYSVHMGNCRAERRAKLSNDLKQSGAPQQGCRVRSKGRGWGEAGPQGGLDRENPGFSPCSLGPAGLRFSLQVSVTLSCHTLRHPACLWSSFGYSGTALQAGPQFHCRDKGSVGPAWVTCSLLVQLAVSRDGVGGGDK